ncbi:DNA glycosylase [Exidia glandulosa HHB12029]|uniref:Endonuclease III homolog n=1 Tax=Exidia glandulosa HHB12029 TaxID=1314781 RepID=A0A165KM03_EXIGL|nr:DNA glycosylase [Exidia glandulosa HHB12029]
MDEHAALPTGVPTPKKKANAASPKKQKPIQMELAVPHPAPEHWREVYDLIHKMREGVVAPVDTMGCHTPAELEEDPKTKRFVTLMALMLSSQTKDEVTHTAIGNLRTALNGLTLENVLAAEDSVISGAIAKVGFWRRKTEYIKKASQKLKDDFDGDVPKTVDELCSLPGVGPKMAFLCLQSAWKLNVGIGVDTHVHRISNRLGWHKPPTTTPEQTRLNLQSWLPKELHYDVNHMLVGFGQTICVPVGPKCDQCELSVRKLCPSARVVKVKAKGKGKAKVEIAIEDESELSEPGSA